MRMTGARDGRPQAGPRPQPGPRPPAGHRGVRLVASLSVLLLLLLACETADGPADEEPSTIVIDEGEQQPESEPEPSASSEGDPGDPPPEGTEQQDASPGDRGEDQPPTPPEPDAPDPPAPAEDETDVPDDRGPLGSACRAYLRGDIPGLTVEVLQQSDAHLRPGVIDHLVSTLGEVLDKPAGVRVSGPRDVPGAERTWTVQDLRGFLDDHRREHSGEDRMAMVVLAVAGEFEQQGVLGVALSATEMVIFPDQIGDLGTSLLGGRAPVERAVVVHEAGHLLCLVNISYTSVIDHEDPDHPHHSRHRDSVMYWAVPNDAVSQVFSGAPPDAFHPDDLADLRSLREGRY
jgi:hypothetical protein